MGLVARSFMIPQHLISLILLTNMTGCLAETCSLLQSFILSGCIIFHTCLGLLKYEKLSDWLCINLNLVISVLDISNDTISKYIKL
jgi:hypothetical protein